MILTYEWQLRKTAFILNQTIKQINFMKIKIQILSTYGGILFEFEKENNTQRETILEAVNSGANLYGANLYGANLYGADLSGADLSGANLSGANLYGADLSGANLYGANLYGANLSRANLYGANLYGADLYGADLSGADLSGADLYGADLSGANLSRADLSGANLYGANLSRADLSGANLYGALINPNSRWSVAIKDDLIKIGCKENTIEGWDLWFSGIEEYSTKRGTKEFAKIQAHYESVKVYVLFMKKFSDNENNTKTN